MLSAINSEYLIDTSLARSARRLSSRITVPARRFSDAVRGLSQSSLSSESGNKRSVRFEKSPAVVHVYPSAQSFLLKDELWYSVEECKAMVLLDLAEIGEATNREELETRGLEPMCDPQRVHRRGFSQRISRTIAQKAHKGSKLSSSKLLKSSCWRDDLADSLRRASEHLTAHDKDFTYRLAVEDELQARIIYLEEGGIVHSTADFAAKSADSVKARAARASAAPGVRQSFTALSA